MRVVTPSSEIDALPERLYDLRLLAERGYGSRRWLQEQISAGRVPAVRVAGCYKIRAADLHHLIEPVAPVAGEGVEE